MTHNQSQPSTASDICKDCGLERREHHHDGAAYGICGQFSEMAHARVSPGIGHGIYIASKTRHADRWVAMRAAGAPIISTWIDEAGEGESTDLHDLWDRCVSESKGCKVLVVYREPQDVLKGAWVEIGAALAAGKPVYAVGLDGFTISKYRRIRHFPSIEAAFEAAERIPSVAQTGSIQPEVFVRRLELVRKFIAKEYNDPAQELRGDWIDPRAKPAHDALCLCLQDLSSMSSTHRCTCEFTTDDLGSPKIKICPTCLADREGK